MTTYAGVCYELASIGGNVAYGAMMTKYGAAHWKLHDFGPGGGMGAPGIKPAKIKSLPMLALSGKLCAGISSTLGAACAFTGASFDDNSRAALGAAGAVTCVYGDATGDGFSTSGCVGSRLTISGTSNELVDFSLDMFGKVTTQGAGPGGGGGDTAEFFPFELGTNTFSDALLGFTLTADTGLIPVFGMNSQGQFGWVNIGDVGGTCTLQLMLSTVDAWNTYAAVGTQAATIGLVSPGGGALTIAMTGAYITEWDRGEVNGIMANRVTLSGHGASMLSVT